MLCQYLASTEGLEATFARGVAYGRISTRGIEWAEKKLGGVARNWSPAQQAQLLLCLPSESRTWDLMEKLGPETEQDYWRLVRPYGIRNSTDVERAALKLTQYERPYSAVELLADHTKDEPPLSVTLLVDVLEQAVLSNTEHDRPTSGIKCVSHRFI